MATLLVAVLTVFISSFAVRFVSQTLRDSIETVVDLWLLLEL